MTKHNDRQELTYRMMRVVPITTFVVLCGWGVTDAHAAAKWTIRCVELEGSNRRNAAAQLAETLKQTAGIRSKDVFFRDGADGTSRLYYGRYTRRRDKKTGKHDMPRKMRADLDLLRDLVDESGRRFFLMAIPVRIPIPEVGNPAWALRNVRGTYSLQVAVFEPTDDFAEYKKGAAEYCALLRKKGYEAYYHHTEVSSMVTVGVFGPEAAHRRRNGRTYYSSDVAKLQQDELLKYNVTNGKIIRVRNPANDWIPVPSYLVEMPQPADSSFP